MKVAPGARADAIVGWLGDSLKLRVRAAPEKGRANAAVIALLAEALQWPPGKLRICAGQGSRNKLVEIEGLTADEVRRRLS